MNTIGSWVLTNTLKGEHFSVVHESMNTIFSWVLTNTLKGEYDMYNEYKVKMILDLHTMVKNYFS